MPVEDNLTEGQCHYAEHWGYQGICLFQRILNLEACRLARPTLPVLIQVPWTVQNWLQWETQYVLFPFVTCNFILTGSNEWHPRNDLPVRTLFAVEVKRPSELSRFCATWPPEQPLSIHLQTEDMRQIHGELAQVRKNFPQLRIRPPLGWMTRPNQVELVPPRVLKEAEFGVANCPEISIVVPIFNEGLNFARTLQSLRQQTLAPELFEVILVDDGSADAVTVGSETFNIRVIRLERRFARERGGAGYRAGLARNFGAARACGRILSFLDSDILLPPDYLTQILTLIKDTNDVVMGMRLDLNRKVESYEEICRERDTVDQDRGYWNDFYARSDRWAESERSWKYLCSHSLSLARETFVATGGFRETFTHYGYEDLDLGLRLYRRGVRFQLLRPPVYHQLPMMGRSEFTGQIQKCFLLAQSARTFYQYTLDPDVFAHCRYLFRPHLRLRLLVEGFARWSRHKFWRSIAMRFQTVR